jgi:hypothetical protein
VGEVNRFISGASKALNDEIAFARMDAFAEY